MGQVEELYKKRQIFNDLFSTIYFDIETAYKDSDGDFICFEVCVKSDLDVIDEMITATLVSITGELEKDIFRFFRHSIPAQNVESYNEVILFKEDAIELLFTDTWNFDYPRLLEKAIYNKIRSIEVLDEQDYWIDLPLYARGVYELLPE